MLIFDTFPAGPLDFLHITKSNFNVLNRQISLLTTKKKKYDKLTDYNIMNLYVENLMILIFLTKFM